MSSLLKWLQTINSFLWGVPLLVMLIGCGGYLTYQLKGIQIRKLKSAIVSVIKHKDESDAEGDVSSVASLLLALAATIGMGNVIGVATAIKVGGAGALFWMWIAGILGMATQYSEALLSIKYRIVDSKGQMLGGPMIYLDKGLKMPVLGKIFAIFAIGTALFGTGNFSQSQTVTETFRFIFNIPIPVTSVILGLIVAFLAFTGIKNLTRMAVITMPFIMFLYIFGALILVSLNIHLLPQTLLEIFNSAFSFKSINGGLIGTGIVMAIKQGFRRGTFSSEAGMGSTPMAAATARTSFPAHQGMIFMLVTFVDTIVINSITGLLILFSGTYKLDMPVNDMVFKAFDISFGGLWFGRIILTVSIIFFTFTTLITWQYYGERCVVYLFGYKAVPFYKVLFIGVVVLGGYLNSEVVWLIADTGNALMVIPNIIALVLLAPVVVKETQLYFDDY